MDKLSFRLLLVILGLSGCGEAFEHPFSAQPITLPGPAQSASEPAPAFSIQAVGALETVFRWRRQACVKPPDWDSPDMPPRALRVVDDDDRERIMLVSGQSDNRRMLGTSFDNLTQQCNVILGSAVDPDPSKLDYYNWIDGLYTIDGRTIYAAAHNEYLGNEVARTTGDFSICPSASNNAPYTRCHYSNTNAYWSHDGGASFRRAAPPHDVIAALPTPYIPDGGTDAVGREMWSFSNIIRSPVDGHVYAFVHQAVNPQLEPGESGPCLLRVDPESHEWRFWDGQGFNGKFVNPYANDGGDPAQHVCKTIPSKAGFFVESVTYNTRLKRHLAIMLHFVDLKAQKIRYGTYYATSKDMIHWSDPVLIWEHQAARYPASRFPGGYQRGSSPDPLAYPSLIDHDSPGRSFEYSDDDFYIYYVRVNNHEYDSKQRTPDWSKWDKDIVRRRIKITVPTPR